MTAVAAPHEAMQGAAASPSPAPLLLRDLLLVPDELGPLVRDRLAAGDRLDAFLLAAGLHQVIVDWLHPDPLELARVAHRLRDGHRRGAWATAVTLAARTAAAAVTLRRDAAAERCAAATATLLDGLAGAVVDTGDDGGRDDLDRLAESVTAMVGGLPRRLRRTPQRLPSCFRSLDQRPEDVVDLMEEVMREQASSRPMLVVGVRTSGLHLAPLAAAALRRAGGEAGWTTVRPGHRLRAAERGTLHAAAASRALVVLLDDPPITWGSMTRAARMLEEAGFRASSVVLAVATLPSTPPPPQALRAHPLVTLPWERWAAVRRLEPAAAGALVEDLLGGAERVVGVRRVAGGAPPGRRGHVGAVYDLRLRGAGGRPVTRRLQVRGVGLGYLGAHAVAVDRALPGRLPPLLGLRDGLAVREWLPEERRLRPDGVDSATATTMAGHVLSRARALAVDEDRSLRVGRRRSAWGAAGAVLARGFGGAAPLAWPLTARAARALLTVRDPAIVDGNTGVSTWFRADGGGLVKVGADERAFDSRDLACYDPVFDLAGIAADLDDPAAALRLRRAYEELAGDRIAAERWLLHLLVHHAERRRGRPHDDAAVERGMAGAVLGYVDDVLLAGVHPAAAGPLCAVDLDGVLETSPLGFPATDRRGARSLRALIAHGLRPVAVTGRSLAEARERCRTYRLAGAVAEYGAVVHLTAGGATHELLSEGDRAQLGVLRRRLPTIVGGVYLDRGYDRVVRAYRVDHRGRRRGLTPAQVDSVLAGGGPLRAVQGLCQTDFIPTGVSKERGLALLTRELGAPAPTEGGVALAVGDSASDIGMLRLARLGVAPANADGEVRRAGVRILRRAHQAGLEEAVQSLLGHRPGGCPRCREPEPAPDAGLLLALLGAARHGSRPARLAEAARTASTIAWRAAAVRAAR